MIARDGECIPKKRGAPYRCFGPLTFHHLKKESSGGRHEEGNGVAACAFHNTWVEDYPKQAGRLGLVVR